MNIAVIGIGAVGGYCGAHLSRYAETHAGMRVCLVSRGGMLDAIRADGLTLESPAETFTARPALATHDPRDCGPLDLALVCTKTYHLDALAEQLAPVVGPQTTVLPLLNGVDNAERLQARLPRARVLNGCIYISAVVAQPGIVRHISGPGKVLFGSSAGDHEPGLPVEALLRSAGIPAEYRADIETAVWEKYLFIEPVASAGSLLRRDFGGLLAGEHSRALLEGLLAELAAVAEARQIPLPANIVASTLEKYASFPASTKTSMQLDYEKGRQTEIESFSGYVIRAGRAAGIHTPLHEEVYRELAGK